jgi:predicted MFS family arabinose efflux permease
VPLVLIVFTTVLAHTAYNGSRLTISLNALALGASPLAVGVLMSLFAALPMALGVWGGRLVDRVGVRRPMLAAVVLVAVSVVLPGALPGLAALHLAAAGAGSGFMLFQICVQHAVGEGSTEARRKENFGWLAVGFSVSNFIGPTIAGFAIDHLGHPRTFLLLAVFAFLSCGILAARRRSFSHTPHGGEKREPRSAMQLLRLPQLRRVFIATALLSSAWDLFVFVMPIYGNSIGLSASTIGLILGAFALATFLVRLALPWLSRRMREWTMISVAMGVACVAYALFPLVRAVPALATISFLLGLGLGATQPSIMSLLYATAPAGRAAEAVGVRTVVLNTSHTILPLMFGGLGAALGMWPVFWSMSCALAGGVWFAKRQLVPK